MPAAQPASVVTAMQKNQAAPPLFLIEAACLNYRLDGVRV
jgi:hypothetical protein